MSNNQNLSYHSLDKTFLNESIGYFNFINCKNRIDKVI